MTRVLIPFLLLTACVPQSLHERLSKLENDLASVRAEQQELLVALGIDPDSIQREEDAEVLYTQLARAMEKQNYEDARAIVETLVTDYANTQAGQAARYMAESLAVIGTEVDTFPDLEWIQGKRAENPKATLLVFFETWCPHCQREVPKLEGLHTALGERGLEVLGLSKLSRGTTQEDMAGFIKTHGLTYPIAVENGDASELFGVSGVPAAAIVQDGVVVWRGHPATLDTQMVDDLLKN